MIQLASTSLLFEREKLVQVGNNLPQTSAKPGPYKVAFVFNYPAKQLPPAISQMTEKLVTACRFKPEEAIFINQNEANYFSLNDLTAQLNIKFVLAFGNIRLSRNMSTLAKHRIYKFGDVQIIQTESLENLEKNGAAKKELWGLLMEALNLK